MRRFANKATAIYSSDNFDITFSCVMERSDYGVPGSPTWWEPVPDSIEVDDLNILGVSVDIKALPEDLQSAIYELSGEVDWEPEEEDYE